MEQTPTDSLGFLLHDAARALRREFESRGREHGLSAAQWRLLVHLVREDGAPQARIAELLEIEPISVSRLVDRMEAAGWAERRPDPSDRRVRRVYPTLRATQVFNDMRAMAGDVYDAALAGLSADDRAVLIRALKTIPANLGEAAGTADGAMPEKRVVQR